MTTEYIIISVHEPKTRDEILKFLMDNGFIDDNESWYYTSQNIMEGYYKVHSYREAEEDEC